MQKTKEQLVKLFDLFVAYGEEKDIIWKAKTLTVKRGECLCILLIIVVNQFFDFLGENKTVIYRFSGDYSLRKAFDSFRE